MEPDQHAWQGVFTGNRRLYRTNKQTKKPQETEPAFGETQLSYQRTSVWQNRHGYEPKGRSYEDKYAMPLGFSSSLYFNGNAHKNISFQ